MSNFGVSPEVAMSFKPFESNQTTVFWAIFQLLVFVQFSIKRNPDLAIRVPAFLVGRNKINRTGQGFLSTTPPVPFWTSI